MDDYKIIKRKLISSGAHIEHLFVDTFSSTGRGLSSKKVISPDDKIIGVPHDYLIGVKRAILESIIAQSVLKEAVKSSFLNIEGMQILCLFLIEEIRKIKHEKHTSKWGFYVKTIPQTYTQPTYWDGSIIELLPAHIATLATERMLKMKQELSMLNVVLKKILPDALGEYKYLCYPITWEEYRWAYCSVNSRCIFSDHEQPKNPGLTSSPSDNYFLVPFLDLINHSSQVEIEGKFNFKNNQYEINAKTLTQKNEQVFINYGPHSDAFLLLEYGFINPESVNHNNAVKVPWKTICKYFKVQESSSILVQEQLQNQGLRDFAFCCYGPAYSLVVAVACFIAMQQNRNSTTSDIVQSFVLPFLSISQSKDYYGELKNQVNKALLYLCESLLEEAHLNINKCEKYKKGQHCTEVHLNIALGMWKIQHRTIQTSITLMNETDFFSEYILNCIKKK